MAIRIYDGDISNEYMSSSSDGEWFKVKFDEDGLANFWINSAGLDNDLDLYVYEEESTSSNRLGKSTESPGSGKDDDIIWELPVTSGTYYYVYVKNYGGGSCNYQVKAKNYPQSTGGEFDLGIKDILYRYSDTSDDYVDVEDGMIFELGREIKFQVPVKNYTDGDSPEYTVVVYDEDGNRLDYDEEGVSNEGYTDNAYLYVTVNKPGQQRLKFAIETSDGVDTDDNDNVKYRTVTFSGECDLGITQILYRYSDTSGDYVEVEDDMNFELDREVKFKVIVKNYKDIQSPEYNVVLYDENGVVLGSDDEPTSDPGESNNSYLYVTINEGGFKKLKFIVEPNGVEDGQKHDNMREKSVSFGPIGDNYDIWESGYIDYINSEEANQNATQALLQMKMDFETYTDESIEEIKRRFSNGFDRFTGKFNELLLKSDYLEYGYFDESRVPIYRLKDVEAFEDIHFLRNKLNKVPEKLELVNPNDWEMLPFYKAAFHMSGQNGLFNLKFVSKPDQRYEAVYDRNGNLLTEKNDPVNMGTYNYIGPSEPSGHIACDVVPFYEHGNIKGTGKGSSVENSIAVANVVKFLGSIYEKDHYNEYAQKFDLPTVANTTIKTHQPW